MGLVGECVVGTHRMRSAGDCVGWGGERPSMHDELNESY